MNTTHAYDPQRATRLLPLLRSIAVELEERKARISVLERVERGRGGRSRSEAEVANDRAELAMHRRELRLAMKELERLGCAIDDTDPLTFKIPGISGDPERGYAWRPGDEYLSLYDAAA